MASPLPSPPTSPTSPRTATCLRIKTSRRPDSITNVPPTLRSEGHAERTRRSSQSLSRIVTADLGSEVGTIALASTSVVSNKRRQSSIAYYTPSSPSPWGQRPQLSRTLSTSVDGPRDGEPVTMNGMEDTTSKRSSLVLSSCSPSTRESVSSLDAAGAREREPLTLVEKHADLLHFIAQKERKCLELRDQLAAHEKELAGLKRKWEYIVNRGHDPLQNPPPATGLGGVALDGLKEGVRMIAAGFSDLGGVIHELESGDDSRPRPKPLTNSPRENGNASNTRAKRTGSEHLSTSSMSSMHESVHTSDHVYDGGEGETIVTTVATNSSLARAGSLNYRVHKRASHVITSKSTTPTSVSISSPSQSPKSANLDVGMSLILAPSPTLVPPLSRMVSASTTLAPKLPVMCSPHGSGPATARPVSWMDTMGKKLSELQKGQTFSESQKRASLLLAGVSSTISAALLPGPTATTPAPLPVLTTTTTTMVAATPRTSTSSVSTKSSLSTQPSLPRSQFRPRSESQCESRPYPSYQSMTDWLDEEEEQTVHAGGLLIPDSKLQPIDVAVTRGGEAATGVSSFDDDWNW